MPNKLINQPDDLKVAPLQDAFEDPRSLALMDKGRIMAGALIDNERPIPPGHPPAFKPDPFINDPLVQQLYRRIARKVPRVLDTTGKVVVGPNDDTLEELKDSKYTPLDYDQLNLLGTTNVNNGNVSLNPRLITGHDPGKLLNTLSHELTHTAGFGDTKAYQVGNDMQTVNDKDSLFNALKRKFETMRGK